MKSVIKNKDMSTETKEQTKPKMYVWARTERAGDIVTVEGTDGQYTTFTDGTKCATALIGEMLMEARDEVNANNIAKDFNASVVEPQRDPEPVAETKATQPTGEVNVMLEMLRKISAKNTISMPLELNVPSKEVYDLFRDQMDITKEELNNQILDLVLSQIDNLQEQLKPQAQEFINKYYYGKNTRRVSTTDEGATRSNRSSSNSAPDITY
jgi:hypothetical protein